MNEEKDDLFKNSNSVSRFEKMLDNGDSEFFDVEEIEEIIEHYLDNLNLPKALKALKYGEYIYPKSIRLLLKKAQLMASEGKLNKGLEILDSLLKFEPYSEEAWMTKGSILSQLRQHKQALECYNKVLELNPEEKDEIYLEMAFEYEHLREFNMAIDLLKKAVQINEKNEAALFELAFCYEQANENDKCIAFYEDFIDSNPYSFSAWYNLGNAFLKTEQYKKAIEAYDYCIAIQENFSSAYFNKANAYIQMEKYEEAVATYFDTFEYEKPQAITYCYIAECFEKLGLFDKAVEYYKYALEINPESGDALIGYGITLDLMGNSSNGIDYIRKATNLYPQFADYWHLLAEAEDKLDNFKLAQAAFIKAIELEDDNIEAWLDYIQFAEKHETASEALLLCEMALGVNAKNESLLYRKVALLLKNSELKEAYSTLELALALDYDLHNELFEYFPDAKQFSNVIDLIDLHKK